MLKTAKSVKKTNHRTVKNLLADKGFLAWFFQTDPYEIKTWDRWIAAHPDNQLLAEQAIHLIMMIRAMKSKGMAETEITITINQYIGAMTLNNKRR